jgi:hypothetical protein
MKKEKTSTSDIKLEQKQVFPERLSKEISGYFKPGYEAILK